MNEKDFEYVFLGGLLAGSALRVWYARPSGDKGIKVEKDLSGLEILLMAGWGLGQLAAVIHVFSDRLDFADYPLPLWAGWPGTGLFGAGLLLLWRSHADLGRNWSAKLAIRSQHTLITVGLYRHIRHPMYAAHLLWGLGQALLIPNWIAGLGPLAVFLPLLMVRAPREEELLIEEFGDEYREYIKRTGRILPRIRPG